MSEEHWSWYEASTGNHQGLVIEERTGRNIAVTYDKAHTKLIAAAPDLLEACENTLAWLGKPPSENDDTPHGNSVRALIAQCRAAIAKATDKT